MEAPRLLRTKGAAVHIGYAPNTLEKLRCTGGGPKFIRRGKAVYYDIRDLDEWLASLPRFESTSEADAGTRPLCHDPERETAAPTRLAHTQDRQADHRRPRE